MCDKKMDSQRSFLAYLLDELVSGSTGALTLAVTIVRVIRELQRKDTHPYIVYISCSSSFTLDEFNKILPAFCLFSL